MTAHARTHSSRTSRSWNGILRVFLMAFVCLGSYHQSSADESCRPVDPVELSSKRDYYSAVLGDQKGASSDWQKLKTVELNHFNSDVRNLVRGQTVSQPGGDIMFVLNIFPNHIPALQALVRLSLRDGTQTPLGVRTPVHCTLKRAISFRPDDPMTRVLYGVFLAKTNQAEKAIDQLLIAEQGRPNDPNVLYNLGLLYFDKKDYEKSLSYARRAYQAGFPLPGLRNKLSNVGKWKDG